MKELNDDQAIRVKQAINEFFHLKHKGLELLKEAAEALKECVLQEDANGRKPSLSMSVMSSGLMAVSRQEAQIGLAAKEMLNVIDGSLEEVERKQRQKELERLDKKAEQEGESLTSLSNVFSLMDRKGNKNEKPN